MRSRRHWSDVVVSALAVLTLLVGAAVLGGCSLFPKPGYVVASHINDHVFLKADVDAKCGDKIPRAQKPKACTTALLDGLNTWAADLKLAQEADKRGGAMKLQVQQIKKDRKAVLSAIPH